MNEAWQITYVRHVLAEKQVTPSALAKAAGFSSTTLTRALNRADHKLTLSLATLDKIQHVTGVSYAPFSSRDVRECDDLTSQILDRLSELDERDRGVILSLAEGMISRRRAAGP